MYTKTGEEKATSEALLAELRDEVDELRRRNKQFERILLSTRLLMGHELRRPVTAIAGFLDLVADNMGAKSESEALAFVKKARGECDRLSELNALFLELLRFDSEDAWVGRATTILGDVVEEIIASFPSGYDTGKRVQVSIAGDVPVLPINRRAVRVILTNLIENALFYSETTTPVQVSARMEKNVGAPDETSLLLEVRDNGVGIPDDYLDKVFDPFVRLRSEVAVGSGLGLTMVKALVELSNGKVTIDSTPGDCTRVRVVIPIDYSSAENVER